MRQIRFWFHASHRSPVGSRWMVLWVATTVAATCSVGLHGTCKAVAQTQGGSTQPGPTQSGKATAESTRGVQDTSQSALTEGLLDLLSEPSPAMGEQGSFTPADVGLDGEDLGEQTDNPLEAVRQSMLIAAGLLRRGDTAGQTQMLQQDIVTRLDELIAQLEDTQESSSQNSEQQQGTREQTSTTQSESQSLPFSVPSSGTTESSEKDEQEGETSESSNAPGQKGGKADPILELADPRSLQQSIWGQLPEQVRKQMQSRMVERFLPSHREEIEAYFRALLKQER